VGGAVERRLLSPDSVELRETEAKVGVAKPKRTNGKPRLRFFAAATDALLVERIEVASTRLWLYGAGHVGQALVRVLTELPFEITWIDERAQMLPADLPCNVRSLHSQSPLETVRTAPCETRFLVMTHDHALDYALCHAILERDDFAWLGLIGSKSKGARFRSRLSRDGISSEAIARLVCPIGVEGIDSKSPAAIAVAVAAQLLQGLSPDHRTNKQPPTGRSTDTEGDCAVGGCQNCASAPKAPS
jgi:xanthine dehydrogenase accessory factor